MRHVLVVAAGTSRIAIKTTVRAEDGMQDSETAAAKPASRWLLSG
jgi:hypothetical protein